MKALGDLDKGPCDFSDLCHDMKEAAVYWLQNMQWPLGLGCPFLR